MSQQNSSFLKKIDLFAFTPIPSGEDYSSKRSRYGTLIFIIIYLSYMGYIFYTFFAQNLPVINQFTNRLDDNAIYQAPEMAFAFVSGDNLNTSFYDPTYFTFTFQQVTVYANSTIPRNYTSIPMVTCRPDWLNPLFDVLCPVQVGYAQGLLYGSPVNMYPRMRVTLCNNVTTNNSCTNISNIQWTLMTGRLFVFLKQPVSYDFITRKPSADNVQFASYYYFIVMDEYNRAELKLQAENVEILPNLLTSFKPELLENLNLDVQNFYVSKVPVTSTHDLFVWWCSMLDTTLITSVSYTTILDVLSDIGAMWGFIFAVFALYFLRFNQNRYYSSKPHMMNFDDKISPLVMNNPESEASGANSSSMETGTAKTIKNKFQVELTNISSPQRHVYENDEIY